MTDQESEAPVPKKKSPFWWTRKDGQTDEEDEGEEEAEEEEEEDGEGEEEGDEEARVNDPRKRTQ